MKFIIAVCSVLAVLPQIIFAEHRSGEIAQYEVDKNRKRTSAIIDDGDLKVSVNGFIPQKDDVEARYKVEFDYALEITLYGSRKGKETAKIEESFLNYEFLEELRESKILVRDDYRLQHLGYKDVRTLSKVDYMNCDIVLIDKIDMKKSKHFASLKNMISQVSAIPRQLGKKNSIKDLKVTLFIHSEVPALRAVQINLKAKVNDLPIKIGLDYKEENID